MSVSECLIVLETRTASRTYNKTTFRDSIIIHFLNSVRQSGLDLKLLCYYNIKLFLWFQLTWCRYELWFNRFHIYLVDVCDLFITWTLVVITHFAYHVGQFLFCVPCGSVSILRICMITYVKSEWSKQEWQSMSNYMKIMQLYGKDWNRGIFFNWSGQI